MDKEIIKEKIKFMLIRRLMLDIKEDDIKDDMILIGYDENGNGLGLDSIDILDIIVGIKEEFGIKVTKEENKKFIETVSSIADYIADKLSIIDK
jgi:acyl carrier protein